MHSESRIVKPDFKDDINITNWPDFHNGVSMGLQITKEAFENANKENLRTWIDYQRSETPKFEDRWYPILVKASLGFFYRQYFNPNFKLHQCSTTETQHQPIGHYIIHDYC